MRVPLSWLSEYVDIDLPVEELAARLTMAGLEVSSIDRVGVPGGALPWDSALVLVCNILEVKQHPNADKLVLADVDYGGPAPHTVVTGAPNIQQYKDQGPLAHPLKSVFAREGAELYDGHAEGLVKVRLKGRPVRGVMSDAMLCSEKELGISEEHEGILLLPDDAPVGAPLHEYLGETIIAIDVLPNTARCLSVLGVAREVAALTGKTLRLPQLAPATIDDAAAGVQLRIDEPALCPRFTARLVEGVTIGASPFWMQRRLTMAGLRPISNIVDISNYVMLELGQPNHIFDADQVAARTLVVRRPAADERLTTLDGKEHALTPQQLLVADPQRALSLAGVMGGASSEVRDTTTHVIVEAAIWEPTVIRRMATSLRARSEASKRFERGVDIEIAPLVQARIAQLLHEIAGGTPAAAIADAYTHRWQSPVVALTAAEVRRLLGLTMSVAAIAELLRPLGFACKVLADRVEVTVPSFRADVSTTADLCEELARMYGTDKLPTTTLADALPVQRTNPVLMLEQRAREVLVGAGLAETITYSLTSPEAAARVAPAALAADYVRLRNPITADRTVMRRSLLPTLLDALAQNLREMPRVQLFEIGRAYLPVAGQVLPDEPRRVAIAMAGPRGLRGWQSADAEGVDFFDIKGVVEALMVRLNIPGVRYGALTDDERFQPGRAAQLLAADGTVLGVLGELHPVARERLAIVAPRVALAELELGELIARAQPAGYQTISRFSAITRDLALVVREDTSAERVAAALRKYGGPTLDTVQLFDVYRGAPLEPGTRSLAYALAFRVADRALSDEEVTKTVAKIVKGIGFDVGATLRTG